jgi:hypothetical protein
VSVPHTVCSLVQAVDVMDFACKMYAYILIVSSGGK